MRADRTANASGLGAAPTALLVSSCDTLTHEHRVLEPVMAQYSNRAGGPAGIAQRRNFV
jgi:hypothetical protein